MYFWLNDEKKMFVYVFVSFFFLVKNWFTGWVALQSNPTAPHLRKKCLFTFSFHFFLPREKLVHRRATQRSPHFSTNQHSLEEKIVSRQWISGCTWRCFSIDIHIAHGEKWRMNWIEKWISHTFWFSKHWFRVSSSEIGSRWKDCPSVPSIYGQETMPGDSCRRRLFAKSGRETVSQEVVEIVNEEIPETGLDSFLTGPGPENEINSSWVHDFPTDALCCLWRNHVGCSSFFIPFPSVFGKVLVKKCLFTFSFHFFLPREKTDTPLGLLCIDFVFSTNQHSLVEKIVSRQFFHGTRGRR